MALNVTLGLNRLPHGAHILQHDVVAAHVAQLHSAARHDEQLMRGIARAEEQRVRRHRHLSAPHEKDVMVHSPLLTELSPRVGFTPAPAVAGRYRGSPSAAPGKVYVFA